MHNQLLIDISKHDENAEPCHLNQRCFPILLQQAMSKFCFLGVTIKIVPIMVKSNAIEIVFES